MKKQLALLTALALLAGASAPAFAETTETDISVICTEGSYEDTAEETAEAEEVLSDDNGEAKDHNIPQDIQESEDQAEDDTPTDEQPADTPAADTTDDTAAVSDVSTLTDDEAEYMTGDWYTWDAQNGILTLRGQLPNTGNHNLAYLAGISTDDIKKVVITSNTKAGTSTNSMFNYFRNITEIQGLNNLDTSAVTDMEKMFSYCNNLIHIDLSGFNTRNVTNMKYMFNHCDSLSSLDVSNFKTKNVTDMSGMFCYCVTLKSLDLWGFDTSNVTDMSEMFFNTYLEKLDVTSFDTRNVSNMRKMFSQCRNLKELDIENFELRNSVQCSKMFYDSWRLETIKVSYKWDNRLIITSDDMFVGCYHLKGNNGTAHDDGHIDAEYARIDGGPSRPGYLTGPTYAPPAAYVLEIKPVFGGKTVSFDCIDSAAAIYYQTGSSNVTGTCSNVRPGEEIFFNTPMSGRDACIYFMAYDHDQWSPLNKWGLLNVKIDKPLIVQSGAKTANNFKIYSQAKDTYLVYTLDGSTPTIEEGTNKLKVTNGKIVWGTSAVINVPKGRTVKAIAVRCGLVTSDVMTYVNK